ARVPGRVLPGSLGDEAQVRPAARADRSVPDELPVAGARLEGDPWERGRVELVPRLDGLAVGRPPALAAPVQQVRGDARARVRLDPVRRAADLRLPGEPRPAPARGGSRSGCEPLERVPSRHAAAEP